MRFDCPQCRQRLEVLRPKRNVCSYCGCKLPSGLIVNECGQLILKNEEDDAEAGRQRGRRTKSLQQLIARLRTLDPDGIEFYTAASHHLRKQSRPNRTYGFFFLLFGTASLIVSVFIWPEKRLWALFQALGGFFFGSLGLMIFYHAQASIRYLCRVREGENGRDRVDRLRTVALNNLSDPVSALVLELTEDMQPRT